jgi:hypothetical protein
MPKAPRLRKIDDRREKHAGRSEEEDTERVLFGIAGLAHNLVLANVPDNATSRGNEDQLHARVVPETGKENAKAGALDRKETA